MSYTSYPYHDFTSSFEDDFAYSFDVCGYPNSDSLLTHPPRTFASEPPEDSYHIHDDLPGGPFPHTGHVHPYFDSSHQEYHLHYDTAAPFSPTIKSPDFDVAECTDKRLFKNEPQFDAPAENPSHVIPLPAPPSPTHSWCSSSDSYFGSSSNRPTESHHQSQHQHNTTYNNPSICRAPNYCNDTNLDGGKLSTNEFQSYVFVPENPTKPEPSCFFPSTFGIKGESLSQSRTPISCCNLSAFHHQQYPGLGKFQCPIESCNTYFQKRCGLASHIKSHENPRGAARRLSLTQSHKSRRHSCDSVSSAPSSPVSSPLRDELMSDPSENLQSCEICAKSFLRRQDLRRHRATHLLGPRRFRCDNCDTTFSRSDAL